MPARQLEATVRWVGVVPVVELRGDIDAPGEHVLEGAFKTATSTSAPLIVLNLLRVGFINSKGIALIVSLLARTRRAGRRLSVYGLSDHYRHIFEITRLSEYIAIYDDESAALAAVLPVDVTPPIPENEPNS